MSHPAWLRKKYLHRLSGRLASLGIIAAQLKAPLGLSMPHYCDVYGGSGGSFPDASLSIPHYCDVYGGSGGPFLDASLSDSCTGIAKDFQSEDTETIYLISVD